MGVTLLAVALLLPVLLLALLLMMERVERPLRVESVSDQLESFLASARPEEVETYVSEGFAPALERYWRRRRLSRLLPGRPRSIPRDVGHSRPVTRTTGDTTT